MHYYYISLCGYGNQVSWNKLSKECFEFYQENDELLDDHLFDDNNDVPEFANLTENGEVSYFELNDIDSEYYINMNSARVYIEETDENNNSIKTLLEEDLLDFIENYEIEVKYEKGEKNTDPYVLQIVSEEKGTFWECCIISQKEIDLNQISFVIKDARNEEDEMIMDISYKGVSLDNNGADTRGKGCSAYLLNY